MIRAVFFDLGDTLIYTDIPWDEIYARRNKDLYNFLKNNGISVDYEKVAAVASRVFNELTKEAEKTLVEVQAENVLSRIFFELGLGQESGSLVRDALEPFYASEVEAWKLYPDVAPTLAELKKMGLKVAVISNAKSHRAIQAILNKFQLELSFDAVLTSSKFGLRKPRREIFEAAMTQLKVLPSESVMVGNLLDVDVLGAKNAGMKGVLFDPARSQENLDVDPDAVISAISSTVGLVRDWV